MKKLLTLVSFIVFCTMPCHAQQITKKYADSCYTVGVKAYKKNAYSQCLESLKVYAKYYHTQFEQHPDNATVKNVNHMMAYCKQKMAAPRYGPGGGGKKSYQGSGKN